MRVALDATYSVDPQPSGIAVYSCRLLSNLSALYPAETFLPCYRPRQFLAAARKSSFRSGKRLLIPGWPTFRADVFHALNQRVDSRPAPRVVSTFHDLFVLTGEYSTPDFRARFSEQARRAAGNSDLIVAVSHFTAAQVTSLLGVSPSKVRVIYHGVDAPPPNADFKPRKQVLFVGALQARKNLIRLVEAFETMPDDWRLVLAGAPTGFRAKEILARIEQSRCRERIRLTGYVSREQLEGLYSSSLLFAFPSLDEGFGIPILEAMAWGVPVITSNGSALREIASNAALLVDPTDSHQIAHALNRAASDADLRRDLIDRGKRRVREFTWQKAAEQTFAAYQELAGCGT